MDFMAEVQASAFWASLLAVIWVNVILSGDNAVVIALAARSLPPPQKRQAMVWGAAAAAVSRIALTIVAGEFLKLPLLKIIGGLVVFWIAVKLLVPEGGEDGIQAPGNPLHAIRTILVADLVMSLDNVIAVAAAAQGGIMPLVLGLALSIPLVVLGASLLMEIMERFPIIITLGAAVLGGIAGKMLISDPLVADWIAAEARWMYLRLPGVSWLEIGGALFVVALGKWLARRRAGAATPS